MCRDNRIGSGSQGKLFSRGGENGCWDSMRKCFPLLSGWMSVITISSRPRSARRRDLFETAPMKTISRRCPKSSGVLQTGGTAVVNRWSLRRLVGSGLLVSPGVIYQATSCWLMWSRPPCTRFTVNFTREPGPHLTRRAGLFAANMSNYRP